MLLHAFVDWNVHKFTHASTEINPLLLINENDAIKLLMSLENHERI